MSSDDVHFLDQLSRVSTSVSSFFTTEHLSQLAEQTDRALSSAIRTTVSQVNSALGLSIPLPSDHILVGVGVVSPPPAPVSFWERSHDWIVKNRAVTAAVIAFLGTGVVGAALLYNHAGVVKRKRKVGKARNGSRTEVVVIAGVTGSTAVRSLSLDLEKRGFVVHVVTAGEREEQVVKGEGRLDIKPLALTLGDVSHLFLYKTYLTNIDHSTLFRNPPILATVSSPRQTASRRSSPSTTLCRVDPRARS
jgi:hypothetical protein